MNSRYPLSQYLEDYEITFMRISKSSEIGTAEKLWSSDIVIVDVCHFI